MSFPSVRRKLTDWSFPRSRLVALLLVLVTLIPIGYIGAYTAAASRNIVYSDEVDTVLALLLKLDAGLDWQGFFQQLSAINNEHRMLTSRLMFAISWWLTGTVDFRVIGAIGNLFLVGVCLMLVGSAGTGPRRLRMFVLLGFLLFQLEHFENFLWSGASIDHFQVVALAIGAFVALARNTRTGLAVGLGLAVLASFTLAHGLVTWLVGAFLLWRTQRRVALGIWCAVAVAASAAFFDGFEVNPGHQIAEFEPAGLARMLHYWLALLGAPLAMDYAPAAPFAGLLLLACLGWQLFRRAWDRESIAGSTLLFCLGALALISLGRSELNGGLLHSRYMILSALAWALMIFVALERVSVTQPHRALAWALPAFALFNLIACLRFNPRAEAFIEGRDRAAMRFKQFGRDGQGAFSLYPESDHSSRLINAAARRGLYWIPRMCERTNIEQPEPSGRIQYFVDEMTADTRAVYISGWAAIPGVPSRRGELHVVLRSSRSFIVLTTVTVSRPDVAKATNNPNWRLSGFQFAVGRWRLPPEELQLGFLVKNGDQAEYIMTDHRIRPYGRGEALLAGGP